MFTPDLMPRYDSSHELTMKKKRQAEQQVAVPQHHPGVDHRHYNGGEGQHGHDARRQRTGPPPAYNYNGPQGQGYGGGGGGGGAGGRGSQHGRPPAWQQEKR